MIAILTANKTKQLFLLPFLTFVLAFFFTSSLGQGNVITGKVTSSTGDPLPGVSVVVKGTKKGTSTDNSGNFSLSGVNSNATLVLSSSGYDRQEIALSGRSNVSVSLLTASTQIRPTITPFRSRQVSTHSGSISERLGTTVPRHGVNW